MNETEQRIIENIAHAKDAAVVLDHLNLKTGSAAEADARAELMAADVLLTKGIDTLETIQAAADQKSEKKSA